eukprot:29593-Eustigmatos_ZCMA.PRE.1
MVVGRGAAGAGADTRAIDAAGLVAAEELTRVLNSSSRKRLTRRVADDGTAADVYADGRAVGGLLVVGGVDTRLADEGAAALRLDRSSSWRKR